VPGAAIEFLPAARLEAEDALGWYLERSPRAGEAFVRELEHGLALIAESPSLCPRFEAGTRRYVLRKFPYSIIYREMPTRIDVVAVCHHKRRPRYWQDR
jgi:toxin ParE1/3/4